ncbi:MAG: hypothetical protein ACFFD4_08005 [Candidatus Odinarchaeota archaeon]
MLLPRKQARKLLLPPNSCIPVSKCHFAAVVTKDYQILPGGEVATSLKEVHQKPVLEKTPEESPNSGTGEHSRQLSPGRLVMNERRTINAV